jgi:hypothetical protein
LALIANLVSAAFGLTCFAWFAVLPDPYFSLAVHFVFTFLIELYVYSLYVRPVRKLLIAAVLIANLLSYVLGYFALTVDFLPLIPQIQR